MADIEILYRDADLVAVNKPSGLAVHRGWADDDAFAMTLLRDALGRGHRALVLTNAMKPMRNHGAALLALRDEFGDRLTLRVSLDHHDADLHDLERQDGSFAVAVDGLEWLAREGFRVHVAGRAAFGRAVPPPRRTRMRFSTYPAPNPSSRFSAM